MFRAVVAEWHGIKVAWWEDDASDTFARLNYSVRWKGVTQFMTCNVRQRSSEVFRYASLPAFVNALSYYAGSQLVLVCWFLPKYTYRLTSRFFLMWIWSLEGIHRNSEMNLFRILNVVRITKGRQLTKCNSERPHEFVTDLPGRSNYIRDALNGCM